MIPARESPQYSSCGHPGQSFRGYPACKRSRLVAALRILIVDDNDAVRAGIRALLASRTDYAVCGEAVDGLDAIAKAEQLHPDVVLMDISMPHMNGLEATRLLQRDVPEAQVLIVSQNDPVMG